MFASTPISRLVAVATVLVRLARANIEVCHDAECGDCPVGLATAGTGFPNCVVYNTDDVLGAQGFTKDSQLGWDVIVSVPDDLGLQCQYILRSPAGADIENCGQVVHRWPADGCTQNYLKDSFMVQFCCGTDCEGAGVPVPDDKKRRSVVKLARGLDGDDDDDDATATPVSLPEGGLSVQAAAAGGGLLLYSNGTLIEPVYVGPPRAGSGEQSGRTKARMRARGETAAAAAPLARRAVCEDGSWQEVEGGYSKTADETQFVSAGGRGPLDVTISKTRTASWSTTMEANLGFADVINIGVSFSTTFSESVESSKQFTFHIDEGENGEVGFTPILMCSRGSGVCNGERIDGEICTPYKVDDDVYGSYAVIGVGKE